MTVAAMGVKRALVMLAAMAALNLFAEGEYKMPMLKWAGKEKVVNHHNDVPFRVLERKWAFGDGACTNGENMVIHGDNLAALKALLPEYEGRSAVFMEIHLTIREAQFLNTKMASNILFGFPLCESEWSYATNYFRMMAHSGLISTTTKATILK